MNKDIQTYLLALLVVLSFLELTAFQASTLFIIIATLLWQIGQQPGILFPPVATIIIAYFFAYPLPMLLPDLYPNISGRVSSDARQYALLWAVRGFGAFALGYALVEIFLRRGKMRTRMSEAFVSARIGYTIYLTTCLGWLAILSWLISVSIFGVSLVFIEAENPAGETVSGTLLQVLTLLTSLRYPFILSYLILFFWKKTDRHLYVLFVTLLLITAVDITTIGSKGSIIRILLAGLMVLAFIPVRIKLKYVMNGVLVIVAIYGSFAVITEYRAIMLTKVATGEDVLNLTLQVDSFTSALLSNLPFMESSAEQQTEVVDEHGVLNRFASGTFSFGNLLKFTNRQSPYVHTWESFLIPIYSLAPRFLLSEKPEFFDSGRNAREYYGASSSKYVGISVTLLGSFYYSWGYAGIILGMASFGGLLSFLLVQWRELGLYSATWSTLSVLLLISMMDVGATFHSILTNVTRVGLLLWMLYFLYPLAIDSMRRRMSAIRMQQVPVRKSCS